MNDPIAQQEFEKLYAILNEAQKQAVDHIEGPVMVIAGPGTGKTQTIALRIANILKNTQIDPSNILCITFTDSATNTMRTRLIQIIGKEAYDIKICTFHSFCNEIIQIHPEHFPEFGGESEPLTEINKIRLFQEILEELPQESLLKPFAASDAYLFELPRIISGMKRDVISVENLEQTYILNMNFHEKTKQLFADLKKVPFRELTLTKLNNFIFGLHQDSEFNHFSYVEYLTNLIEKNNESLAQLRNKMTNSFDRNFSQDYFSKQKDLITVYKLYQQKLRDKKKYDYEDMILKVVDKFTSNKELLNEYQERYQYILVDEYQDTNNSQNDVVRLLGSFWPDPNVFVVGDDDQSIYRFQGASVENLKNFYQRYLSKIKVLSLTKNYRSQQLILDASRAVIANNGTQIEELIPSVNKKLETTKSELPKVLIKIRSFDDPKSECFDVVHSIMELKSKGVQGREIAIIYRDNKDSNDIREALEANSISYRMDSGDNVLDNWEIKKIINFMKYLIEPENEVLLFQILNFEYFGFDPLDIAKIYTFKHESLTDLSTILSSVELLKTAGVQKPELFIDFTNKIAKWRQRIISTDGLIFFNELIRETNILTHILKHKHSYLIINRLTRLYDELKELINNQENYTLVNFINDISIYIKYHLRLDDDLIGINNDDAVRLMTAHGAKGQEFDHVFIIKCQDRKWGNKISKKMLKLPLGLSAKQYYTEEIDEERRLFFVAMTRAKKEISISYAMLNQAQKAILPSKFIKEIPRDLTEFSEIKFSDEQKAEFHHLVINISKSNEFTSDGKNFISSILKNFKLSSTNLSAYRKCPRCFYFNTILKLPKIKNRASILGSAVHYALDKITKKYRESKSQPSIDFLLENFIFALKKERMSEDDFQDCLEHGKLILNNYYQYKKDEICNCAYSEINFQSFNINVDNIPITGKLDRIDLLDQNRILVIDYKTGNPDNAASKLSIKNLGDYYIQVLFYKLLVESSRIFKGVVDKGRIEFIEPSKKTKEFVTKEFEITQEAIDSVKALIKNTYERIQEFDFAQINEDSYNKCDTEDLHKINWKI